MNTPFREALKKHFFVTNVKPPLPPPCHKPLNEVEFQLEDRQTDRQHTLGLVEVRLLSENL